MLERRLAGTGRLCGALGIVAAASAILFPDPSSGQPLPDHQVRFSAETASCSVSFVPDATTGDNPPELELSVNMISEEIDMQLIGASYTEQIFLWGETRIEMRPLKAVSVEELTADMLWQGISAASQEGAPFYWTVQEIGGAYSSARYDDLSPVQIARTLSLACNINVLNPPVPTEIEAKRAEARLALTSENVIHIRRLLFSLYGEPGAQPGTGSEWTVTDRRLIDLYNQENEIASGSYLTEAAVADLLERKPVLKTPEPELNSSLRATYEDWSVYAEDDGATCSVMTPAQTTSGYTEFERPFMRFSVSRSGSGGLMAIELSRPNAFAPSAQVRAIIDGQSTNLMTEASTGALVPRPLADGRLSNSFTIQLRRGREIAIEGTSLKTGEPMRLTFSALGFTAAFRVMSEICNRPGVLGWIR
jgi:hypothetical protein